MRLRLVVLLAAIAIGLGSNAAGQTLRIYHIDVEQADSALNVMPNRIAQHTRYRAAEKSYRGIVFAPRQFSCWNAGTDANHLRLIALAERVLAGENLTEPAWIECAWVAVGIVEDRLRDRSRSSTHYLTTTLYHSDAAPRWAKRLQQRAILGSHVFLVEPPEPSFIQRA